MTSVFLGNPRPLLAPTMALLLSLGGTSTLGGCSSSATSPRDARASNEGASSDTGNASAITVEVAFAGQTYEIALSEPAKVTLSGGTYARLSDVLGLALPQKDLKLLRVDFEASDGFRPGQSPNCPGITPIPGENLTKGYVHTESRNVRWDDSLGFPGCMGVSDLARILVSDK
ncbi:MAG: hypothetical protein KAI47_00340 [Deltaproteobacteria bacterium]|nr:hypothetical protein [Deltaproteobacteria bacterium]